MGVPLIEDKEMRKYVEYKPTDRLVSGRRVWRCRVVCPTTVDKSLGSVGRRVVGPRQQRGLIVGHGDPRATEDPVGQLRTTAVSDTGLYHQYCYQFIFVHLADPG